MKERPILFSGEMVRALLAGRKTQTRRVVKSVYAHLPTRGSIFPAANWEFKTDKDGTFYQVAGSDFWNKAPSCPYGAPGDRLWVRETHLPTASGVYYRADFSEFEAAGHGAMYGGWKPSIFCRRPHSRLTLEIVAVRVERLLSISEEDAVFEGVTWPDSDRDLESIVLPSGQAIGKAVIAYKELWESINGPGSWALNPWVWVIEFKKLEAGV